MDEGVLFRLLFFAFFALLANPLLILQNPMNVLCKFLLEKPLFLQPFASRRHRACFLLILLFWGLKNVLVLQFLSYWFRLFLFLLAFFDLLTLLAGFALL
jgi:hypothetical protein